MNFCQNELVDVFFVLGESDANCLLDARQASLAFENVMESILEQVINNLSEYM